MLPQYHSHESKRRILRSFEAIAVPNFILVMNLNEELFRGIKDGDKHRVKELIKSGADVDFLQGMQGTPLCAAISANQLDIARF